MSFLPILTILMGTHAAAAVMPAFPDEKPPAPTPIQYYYGPPPGYYGMGRPPRFYPRGPGEYAPYGLQGGGMMDPEDMRHLRQWEYELGPHPRYPRWGGRGWGY